MEKPPFGLAEAFDQKGMSPTSDTSLNSLMSPNVRKMSNNNKMMCGCEIYISKGYAKQFENIQVIIDQKIWE